MPSPSAVTAKAINEFEGVVTSALNCSVFAAELLPLDVRKRVVPFQVPEMETACLWCFQGSRSDSCSLRSTEVVSVNKTPAMLQKNLKHVLWLLGNV